MKKKLWFKIFIGAFVFLVVAVIGIILYLRFALPSIALEEIKAPSTPEHIARGSYLANHVMVCMDCHSTRDWTKFSGPLVPGTLGKGGEIFDEKLGFPGSFASPNITPFKLKDWTDAEIYRAITSGVTKDGKALFPIMPYPYYGQLDKEDILSVIAYLRSLPAIASDIPVSEAAFPMSIIVNTIPKPAVMTTKPSPADTIAYGEYIVKAAGCIECHTQATHGQIMKDLAFAGGREFIMPDGSALIAPNITPDMETGIGRWSKEAFIFRFKNYDPATYTAPVLPKGSPQSIMPWTMYAGMDTTDLVAMYRYLHSLKPVNNPLARTMPVQ